MGTEVTIKPQLESELNGKNATSEDLSSLKRCIKEFEIPDWLIDTLSAYKLIGVILKIASNDDISGHGAVLKWKTPRDLVEELYEYYPGVAVISLNCLPIGSCMEGSGDPYFIKLNSSMIDSPVVRIRHDLVKDDDTYLESNFEVVVPNLEALFDSCKVLA